MRLAPSWLLSQKAKYRLLCAAICLTPWLKHIFLGHMQRRSAPAGSTIHAPEPACAPCPPAGAPCTAAAVPPESRTKAALRSHLPRTSISPGTPRPCTLQVSGCRITCTSPSATMRTMPSSLRGLHRRSRSPKKPKGGCVAKALVSHFDFSTRGHHNQHVQHLLHGAEPPPTEQHRITYQLPWLQVRARPAAPGNREAVRQRGHALAHHPV